MRTEKIKGIRDSNGGIRFKFPKGYKEDGVRYIIVYDYLGCTIEHAYHSFWDAPKYNPKVESYRITILDFSK